MGKATQALAGRDRARDARLKAARERRLKLDPDQLARELRIDEASVDVEGAWEGRAQTEQALADAEAPAAAAVGLLNQRAWEPGALAGPRLARPAQHRRVHARAARLW